MILFSVAALGFEACFLMVMFGSEQMRGKPGIRGGVGGVHTFTGCAVNGAEMFC